MTIVVIRIRVSLALKGLGLQASIILRNLFLFSSDDDECATSADNRCDHTQGYCTNTPGSYECHCNRGYRLTADYTCVGKYIVNM